MTTFVKCEPGEATHVTFAGKAYSKPDTLTIAASYIEIRTGLDTWSRIDLDICKGAGVMFLKKAPPKRFQSAGVACEHGINFPEGSIHLPPLMDTFETGSKLRITIEEVDE